MFSSLDHFEINEIEISVNISLYNFNNPHTPGGLSDGDWQ